MLLGGGGAASWGMSGSSKVKVSARACGPDGELQGLRRIAETAFDDGTAPSGSAQRARRRLPDQVRVLDYHRCPIGAGGEVHVGVQSDAVAGLRDDDAFATFKRQL